MNVTRLFALPLFFVSFSLHATTFIIDTPDDLVDNNIGDGFCITATDQCSLRAAIQESNALPGADSLTLPANTYNLTLTGALEDIAATGDLDITDDLTINGAGANQVFIDGVASDRIFQIMKGKNVTINGVTIRNGLADGLTLGSGTGSGGFGGGIKSEGRLILNDCNLDRNKAFNGGTAIYAFFRGFPLAGSLTVNRSNFTYSETLGTPTEGGAGGFGGHIYAEGIPLIVRDSVLKDSLSNSTAGILSGGGIYYFDSTFPSHDSSIINTTISNNRVMSFGGGIHVGMGNLDIINSTISGNAAYGRAGGLSVDASANVTVTNTTIAFNSAPEGAGVYDANTGQFVTFTDSIVSSNIGGNCFTRSAGLLTSGSNIDNDATCGFDISNQDPLLQALNDNGGPGHTHLLGDGSPALNAAGTCLTTDQRSYTRPSTLCDLGAVEMEGTPPAIPVATPAPNNEITPSDPPVANNAPVAFDLPAAVTAGSILYGIMNAYDPDGDPLLYEITQQATQGNAGLPVPASLNDIPGGYTYAPLATATGSDSFKFRACDPFLACSEEKTIYITITSGTVSSELSVELTPDAGNINDLVIVAESELNAIAPDTDYTYPVGAYFFSVDDIPTTTTQTVVTIQLAAEANIPTNAEVRKLDNTGTWQTLSNVASPTTSSAVIDTGAKTITLTLVDNDVFDLNSAVGVINDPVALGVFQPATVTCDPGSYGTVSCVLADPGYFVATSGATEQTPCSIGRYSSEAGATACTLASPGYFVDSIQASAQEECPAGRFSAAAGASECVAAAAGYYVPSTAQSTQTACSAGSYSDQIASIICTLASPGHYVENVAQSSQTACQAGTYADEEGLTICSLADAGYYVANTGASQQTACSAGSFSANTQATACTPTSLGHFVSTSAQTQQTACSPGSYADATGSSSCKLAQVGYFVASSGQSAQTACPAGTYTDITGATACVEAPVGFYVDSIAASAAIACPAGTSTPSTGATQASACSSTISAASSNNGGGALNLFLGVLLLIYGLRRSKLQKKNWDCTNGKVDAMMK